MNSLFSPTLADLTPWTRFAIKLLEKRARNGYWVFRKNHYTYKKPLLHALPTFFEISEYIFEKYIQLTYYIEIFIKIGLQISSGLSEEQDKSILTRAP